MNTDLFYSFYGLAHRWAFLDAAVKFIAEPFGWIVMLSVLALSLIFGRARDRKLWVVAFSSLLTAFISRFVLTAAIRHFYHSLRPFAVLPNVTTLISHEAAGSLPSGHAALFFALAGVLFLWNKKIGALYFAFALLIGVSRVIAGVHWPLDIVAGAALGIATAALLHYPLLKLRQVYGINSVSNKIGTGATKP